MQSADSCEKQKMNQILQSIGQVSIFGPCDASAIQSLESENREKKRLQDIELQKRLHEIEKAEAQRKKEEEEDYQFALEVQKRLLDPKSHQSQSRKCIGGRSFRLLEQYEPRPPLTYRGTGRLPEQNARDSQRRNVDISNHIHQFCGEQSHSNRLQELYWQEENAYSKLNTGTEDQYVTDSDQTSVLDDSLSNHYIEAFSDYVESVPPADYFETADASADYSVNSAYTGDTERNNGSPRSDLASGSDQFKDAEDTPSSSVKQDSSQNPSLSSSKSASPVQTIRGLGIRKVKPRISNFLSNKIAADLENSHVSNSDYFREPSSPNTRPVAASQPSYVSINSLNASQRVIGDVGIRTSDLVRNYSRYSQQNSNFTLNENEFPPL